MVRVGSRSKNEVLEPCNLKNKRIRRTGQLQRSYRELKDRQTRFIVSQTCTTAVRPMLSAVSPVPLQSKWCYLQSVLYLCSQTDVLTAPVVKPVPPVVRPAPPVVGPVPPVIKACTTCSQTCTTCNQAFTTCNQACTKYILL